MLGRPWRNSMWPVQRPCPAPRRRNPARAIQEGGPGSCATGSARTGARSRARSSRRRRRRWRRARAGGSRAAASSRGRPRAWRPCPRRGPRRRRASPRGSRWLSRAARTSPRPGARCGRLRGCGPARRGRPRPCRTNGPPTAPRSSPGGRCRWAVGQPHGKGQDEVEHGLEGEPARAAMFRAKRSTARANGPGEADSVTTLMSGDLDAGIDGGVGDVREDVREDHAGANDERRAHDDGVVPSRRRRPGEAPSPAS